MAFFELPKNDDLPPKSLEMLEEYQRLQGTKTMAPNWLSSGASPRSSRPVFWRGRV
jgi:hypothetical protein